MLFGFFYLVVSWLIFLLLSSRSMKLRRVDALGNRTWRWCWLKVWPILYEALVCNFLLPTGKYRRKNEVNERSTQNLSIWSGRCDLSLRLSLQKESTHWRSRGTPTKKQTLFIFLEHHIYLIYFIDFLIFSWIVVTKERIMECIYWNLIKIVKKRTFVLHPPR